MKKFLNFCIVFCVFVAVQKGLVSQEQSYPLEQMKCLVDGLNIEGARIPRHYLRQDQVWANLCVVLDRPFIDGAEWNEITKNNSYALKESSLLSFNEPKANLAYALILCHYIKQAHKISSKEKDDEVKILIQVHRNTSGPAQLKLLESLLVACMPESELIKYRADANCAAELFSYHLPEYAVRVEFCYGNLPEYLGKAGKYAQADIILSFSLVAGFHPAWQSGSLLVPKEWIPMSLEKMEFYECEKYCENNHLFIALQDILDSQDEAILQLVNEAFRSPNPLKKNQRTKALVKDDFSQATLVQVESMFNPSSHPKAFKKF